MRLLQSARQKSEGKCRIAQIPRELKCKPGGPEYEHGRGSQCEAWKLGIPLAPITLPKAVPTIVCVAVKPEARLRLECPAKNPSEKPLHPAEQYRPRRD